MSEGEAIKGKDGAVKKKKVWKKQSIEIWKKNWKTREAKEKKIKERTIHRWKKNKKEWRKTIKKWDCPVKKKTV